MAWSALLRALVWLAYGLSRMQMAAVVNTSDLAAFFLRLTRDGVLEEYGPLANALMLLPLQMSGEKDLLRYLLAAKAMALVVDGLLMNMVMRRESLGMAAAYVTCSAGLGVVWLDRLDLYIGALLVGAVLAPAALRPFVLAAGGLIKFPFVALAGVGFLQSPSRARMRDALSAVVIFAAALLTAAGAMGPAGTTTAFTFHAGRTLQFESLAGNALYLGTLWCGWPFHVVVDHGAAHVHGGHDPVLTAAGLLLLVAGVLLTALCLWRRDNIPHRFAVLLGVVAYTTFNPVGSLQFSVVIVALAPFCLPLHGRRTLGAWALLTVHCVLAGIAFAHYPFAELMSGGFALWTLARNVVLVALWGWLMAWRFDEAGAPKGWA